MRALDDQEKRIVRELCINPRISDNQISRTTTIPLKTVNRKRKRLESEGLLSYFAYLDTTKAGTGDFGSRQMYHLTLKQGITRQRLIESGIVSRMNPLLIKHLYETYLGEKDGRLVVILIVESRLDTDILEIINAEVLPLFDKHFGTGACIDLSRTVLSHQFNLLHNYTASSLTPQCSSRFSITPNTVFVTDVIA